MPDLHVHRDHHLGLKRARQVARKWVQQAQDQFGMQCSVESGDDGDTVVFSRSGCSGQLQVAADHFTLDARLGFLLGAFGPSIQARIEANLDELLAAPPPRR